MALISDIPTRDGQDGATQLDILRSYLKDKDPAEYKYPDQLLIDLLVKNDKVESWRGLVSHPDGIPWGFSTELPLSYESLIRLHTGDTDETQLMYTDYELDLFLETLPLRYVVKCINLKKEGGSTFPTDNNHPIHVLRKYLNDMDLANPVNTDSELVDKILYSGKDPYALVADLLREGVSYDLNESLGSGVNQLASIDGISFEDQNDKVTKVEKDLSFIAMQGATSVYAKPVYDYYVDKDSQVDVGWRDYWYGI